MILMVMLGVGVFVGFQGEWCSIENDTYSFYDSTGFADYRLVSELGYSLEDYQKIKDIKGVDDISRFLTIKTNETKENDVISLIVTSNTNVSGFVLSCGDEYDGDSINGVWVSDLYAEKNDYKLDDETANVFKEAVDSLPLRDKQTISKQVQKNIAYADYFPTFIKKNPFADKVFESLEDKDLDNDIIITNIDDYDKILDK